MTGRTPDERLGQGSVRAAAVGTVLTVLAGCTGGGSGAGSEEPQTAVTVPNQVPDATVAVTDAPRPETTDVVLSFVGWDDSDSLVEAAGYVSPVTENGGTCTLELEQDGRTVVVTGPGEADASTTVCGGLRVPQDELAAGEWTAVLHYRSATTEGTSQPQTVEVPQ